MQLDGGYFFLMEFGYNRDFWQNTLHSLIQGLGSTSATGRDQLIDVAHRLADRIEVSDHVRDAVLGSAPPTRQALDLFIAALRQTDRRLGA
ncbi:MAG: hypothetical protein M3548_14760, partial [Actinomycetota bacterium]|nr:hypothetical protein [Actinomycetota bacterium]